MATNGNEKYTYQRGDDLLIPALASGKTLDEAAAESNVSKRTISRRQEDSGFREEVQRVRGLLAEAAVGKISSVADEAVNTLQLLLKASSDNVRLGAARAILDFNFRVREEAATTKLNERIAVLEEIIKQKP
jgi:hypothetical protein